MVPSDLDAMRNEMYTYAGVVRNEQGLRKLMDNLALGGVTREAKLSSKDIEAANMLTVCQLIARAALYRQESRGSHCRSDYPHTDDIRFRKHLQVSLSGWKWEPCSGKSSQGELRQAQFAGVS